MRFFHFKSEISNLELVRMENFLKHDNFLVIEPYTKLDYSIVNYISRIPKWLNKKRIFFFNFLSTLCFLYGKSHRKGVNLILKGVEWYKGKVQVMYDHHLTQVIINTYAWTYSFKI